VALADRPVLEAEIKIVLQRAGEEMRRRAGIADAAADNSIVQGGDIDAADGDAPAGRLDEPGEQQAEPAAPLESPDDGDMGVGRRRSSPRRRCAPAHRELRLAALTSPVSGDLVRRVELPASSIAQAGTADDLLVLHLGTCGAAGALVHGGRGPCTPGRRPGAERQIALITR
jgi:hypothetical protein